MHIKYVAHIVLPINNYLHIEESLSKILYTNDLHTSKLNGGPHNASHEYCHKIKSGGADFDVWILC